MDKELKSKWVAALRSGKYKQGANFLRPTDDTYCCLGVLADVHKGKWRRIGGSAWAHDDGTYHKTKYGYAEGLLHFDEQETLMSMNDRGQTFEQIAAYIEANL